MGLFSKKEKRESMMPEMPQLPELPRLPGSLEDEGYTQSIATPEEDIHQLPSFPNTKFGQKMSQNTIKNAISGDDEIPMLPEPSFDISTEPMEQLPEIEKRIPREDMQIPTLPSTPAPISIGTKRVVSDEPIFIRIDKFEDSMKIFEKIKVKISEVEHLLSETKDIKEQENAELNKWQEEIQKIKVQIEKVDQDIFSKIE